MVDAHHVRFEGVRTITVTTRELAEVVADTMGLGRMIAARIFGKGVTRRLQ